MLYENSLNHSDSVLYQGPEGSRINDIGNESSGDYNRSLISFSDSTTEQTTSLSEGFDSLSDDDSCSLSSDTSTSHWRYWFNDAHSRDFDDEDVRAEPEDWEALNSERRGNSGIFSQIVDPRNAEVLELSDVLLDQSPMLRGAVDKIDSYHRHNLAGEPSTRPFTFSESDLESQSSYGESTSTMTSTDLLIHTLQVISESTRWDPSPVVSPFGNSQAASYTRLLDGDRRMSALSFGSEVSGSVSSLSGSTENSQV